MPPGFDHRSSKEGNVNGNCEESEEVLGPQVGQEDLDPQAGEEDLRSEVDQTDFQEEVSDSSSSKRPEPGGFGAFFCSLPARAASPFCQRRIEPGALRAKQDALS